MTVYERIETLRNEKGISQGKLEKQLGLSNGSISKWKNSMPKPERLQKIADYFGVTVDYLMNGGNSDKKISDMILSDNERNLIELFRLVPEKDQELVIDMIIAALKSRNLYPTFS